MSKSIIKKKCVGVDLDGVCFNFSKAFCNWLEEKLGIKCDWKKITSYYWYECTPELTKKVFWEEFHKFGKADGYANLPLIPGAKEALDKIAAAGHTIHFITNRPNYAMRQTLRALKRDGFPGDARVHFAKGDKRPLVRQLNVDVFIDDSPSTITELTTGTQAKVYCMDAPYNQSLDDTRFTRVHNWDEFMRMEEL